MIDLNKYKGKIIAHRGIHDNEYIPENSIKAFKKALDYSYPIELDIQLTKDNNLVVFHDYNLERMTSLDFKLNSLTLEALKELKLLNTSEKIPTLEEVLNLVNGKVLLDIEIKPTNNYKKICDILLKELTNYKGEIVISSFSPRIIKYMKNNSNYSCGLLIMKKTNNRLYDNFSKTRFPIIYSNADFVAISKRLINKYKSNLPIFVWTITNKDEITNPNYTYICNNLPY